MKEPFINVAVMFSQWKGPYSKKNNKQQREVFIEWLVSLGSSVETYRRTTTTALPLMEITLSTL